MTYQAGDKVVHTPTGKVYDFGYLSATPAMAVVYEEGECNGQDASAVFLVDLKPFMTTGIKVSGPKFMDMVESGAKAKWENEWMVTTTWDDLESVTQNSMRDQVKVILKAAGIST